MNEKVELLKNVNKKLTIGSCIKKYGTNKTKLNRIKHKLNTSNLIKQN